MCVTPQHFADQLRVLRTFAHPISLREMVRGLQDGDLPERAVTVTFDDGYADATSHARPLLERYQTPATVFVATGYIGREFWWDELARILLSPATLPERLSMPLNGGNYEWTSGDTDSIRLDKGAPDPRRRLLQSLYERLLPLSPVEREEALALLCNWAEATSDDGLHPRALTADELVELATGGLVDIGAHTVTHPILSNLSVEAQRAEIQGSKARLEELLGRPVTSFSYPNGSLSKETPMIVRAAGFTCACASSADIVWRRSNRFCLPRFWIPNWDGQTFSRWLRRWHRG
jgi:peptidoglycan/xylan/chitin deacetylase (PgdA/CDA1 family)